MLLVVSSLRSTLADWNDVPTGSMKPTIQEGDRVVVNKLAWDLKIPFTTVQVARWDDPKRGDIVVFFSPADGVRLVKRVIALPGDRIAMRDNQLFVNDKAVPQTAAGMDTDREVGPVLIVDEALPGRKHKMMITPQILGAMRSFEPAVVPAGSYFVMGDNRDNSNDSRYIGFIERRRIVGEATAVAFSLDRTRYWRPRFDRFFKALE
jgi:signal peptidase I